MLQLTSQLSQEGLIDKQTKKYFENIDKGIQQLLSAVLKNQNCCIARLSIYEDKPDDRHPKQLDPCLDQVSDTKQVSIQQHPNQDLNGHH